MKISAGSPYILIYAVYLIFLASYVFLALIRMHIELYNADFLNFVEFNLTGDNDNYNRCDVESKYLDSLVFYLFQNCFEDANSTYDYFSGTKYNARKIIVLRNNLIANLQKIEALSSSDAFSAYIEKSFMGKDFLSDLEAADDQWQKNWNEILNKIILVNRDLISLIEKCAFEERVLWVIGY
jgi:hypothetical protein